MSRIAHAAVFKQKWIALALLALLPLLVVWQVSFFQYTSKWDLLDFFFPFRFFISESLAAGEIPWWIPFQSLGYPFYADPGSGFWYPLTWVFSFIGGYNIYTIHLEYILHLVLAGIGAFFLFRQVNLSITAAVVVAIAYQCSGVMVGNGQHLTWIISACWLPFVLLFYTRMIQSEQWKNAVYAGLFSYLMLVGGYPIFFIVLQYVLLVYFVFRLIRIFRNSRDGLLRFLLHHILMYGIFLVLAAPFLVSFYQALPYITRNELPFEATLLGSINPYSLISTVIPFAVGQEWETLYKTDPSMVNTYFGLVPLLFFVYSLFIKKPLWVKVVLFTGIFFLIAAMGTTFPLHKWLFDFVPLMDTFRFPALLRLFSILSFLVVAGFGFHQFFKKGQTSRVAQWLVIALLGVVLFATVFSALKISHVWIPPVWNMPQFVQEWPQATLSQHVFFHGAIQFLLLMGIGFALFKRKKNLLVIVAVADIFIATQLAGAITLFHDANPKAVHEQISALPDDFPVPPNDTIWHSNNNGRYIYPIWHNVSIFHKRVAHDGFNSFRLSSYDHFYDSSERDSILQAPLMFFSEKEGAIELLEFSPNSILAEVESPTSPRLVFLQNYFPGWKAYVDGREAPIEKYAGTFMQIPVSQEAHEVEFVFRPVLVPVLGVISVAALGAILILMLLQILKIKKPSFPQHSL